MEELSKACERLILQLSDDLESNQIDTLEKPTATWSILRAMQIRIDQESPSGRRSWAKTASPHMKQEDARLERVLGRTKDFMRECERGAYFDQKTATEGFRQVLRQREEIKKQLKAAEEEEEKKRQQRRREIDAAAGNDALLLRKRARQASSPKTKLRLPTRRPKKRHPARTESSEDDKKVDAGSDDEGGFFGDLLNEGPIEDKDVETGAVITMRDLPARAKSGGGGKTPRVMLSDALKRADAYSCTNSLSFRQEVECTAASSRFAGMEVKWCPTRIPSPPVLPLISTSTLSRRSVALLSFKRMTSLPP